MLTLGATILFVLGISGICSCVEAALFSIPLTKTKALAEEGGRAALALARIKGNMSRTITAIVVINNVSNIVGSIIVGAMGAKALGNQWLGVISGILTVLVILFAEIIPKTLGELRHTPVALAAALPLLVVARVMFPIIWLVEKAVAPFAHGRPGHITSAAEIKLLARLGSDEGAIEEDESNLIQRAFQLNVTTAENLMTPRTVLTCLPAEATLNEVLEQIIASPHSRIIVIGDTRDDVEGIVLKSELLAVALHGGGDEKVKEHQRDVVFVNESKRADDLLLHFQQSRSHLAVVSDRYGGVAGIVTLEDVLEVLTGEIMDETDEVFDLQAYAERRAKKQRETSEVHEGHPQHGVGP